MSKRKICQGKRCFKSAGAARRSANEREMIPCRVYKCPRCKLHHVTSSKSLHADTDQDYRDLDPLEKMTQDELDRARGDRKVAQAQARNGTGEWFMDANAGVPYVELMTGYTMTANQVHGIDERDRILAEHALAQADAIEPAAYTPDEEFESGELRLSDEAFDEFTRTLEEPPPPSLELIALMHETAVGMGSTHERETAEFRAKVQGPIVEYVRPFCDCDKIETWGPCGPLCVLEKRRAR